jgi:hypothetical protein
MSRDQWTRSIVEPELARRIIILERAAIGTTIFANGYVAT